MVVFSLNYVVRGLSIAAKGLKIVVFIQWFMCLKHGLCYLCK